jgi:hypothetical protein
MKHCFVGIFLLVVVLTSVHAQSQSQEWAIEKVSGNLGDTFGGLLGGHGGRKNRGICQETREIRNRGPFRAHGSRQSHPDNNIFLF